MSKESLVLFFGAVVFLIPHMGIPSLWKDYGLFVSGFLLIIIGYLLRRKAYLRSIDNGNGERSTDTFVENTKPIDFTEAQD
jgi:hypothetical protein